MRKWTLLLFALLSLGVSKLEAKPRFPFPRTPDEVGQNDRDLSDKLIVVTSTKPGSPIYLILHTTNTWTAYQIFKSTIDIQYGGVQGLMIGADNNAFTRTDATQKRFRIASFPYSNSQVPVAMLYGINDSAANDLYIGGATLGENALTGIHLYTANNNTTAVGTEIFTVIGASVGINQSNPSVALDVVGSINSTSTNADPVGNAVPNITLFDTNSGANSAVSIEGNVNGTRRLRWFTRAAGGGGGVSTFQVRDADNSTWDTVFIASNSGAIALQGTKAADNAAAGFYGEYLSSSCPSAINVKTSAQYFDVCYQATLTLTPGDWDVNGTCYFTKNGATYTGTGVECGIGTATGNNSAGLALGNTDSAQDNGTATTWNNCLLVTPIVRFSVSSNTTVFLKGYPATYTAGSPTAIGRISARRIR